ncbi:hypothetical protein PCE1_004917 [Barthelona sp. PCE]
MSGNGTDADLIIAELTSSPPIPPPCREQHFQTVYNSLIEFSPTPMVLTGVPGTGKTLTKNCLLSAVTKKDSPYHIEDLVIVDLMGATHHNTPIRNVICERMGFDDNDVDIFDMLRKLHRVLIVVDEVDTLKGSSCVFLEQVAVFENCFVLGLCNDLAFRKEKWNVVPFRAYTSSELQSILGVISPTLSRAIGPFMKLLLSEAAPMGDCRRMFLVLKDYVLKFGCNFDVGKFFSYIKGNKAEDDMVLSHYQLLYLIDQLNLAENQTFTVENILLLKGVHFHFALNRIILKKWLDNLLDLNLASKTYKNTNTGVDKRNRSARQRGRNSVEVYSLTSKGFTFLREKRDLIIEQVRESLEAGRIARRKSEQ